MARILVVDDESGIREFISEVLIDAGHEVSEAVDGADAVRQLRVSNFDLMMTDLRMPGEPDGMGLLRLSRAEQSDLEVIVLTAYATVETAVEAMKMGAFDYLQKPVSSPNELRLIVERALERRRLLTLQDQKAREDKPMPSLSYIDKAMDPVVKAVEKVAPTGATVLLLGESGTGKEIAARTIHQLSSRCANPFVPVNCAAISESLMESEIFGHEKGAFTGATSARRGRLELANDGTLFLDEIGELKPELQAKLLRVLQEGRFERVGGTRTIEVDVRWIAATNRDLTTMVAEGDFREDLYHRLAVFPIHLLPLRERCQDILPLTRVLLDQISAELGRGQMSLNQAAETKLQNGQWSGNIRELANTLERAAILAEGQEISDEDLVVGLGGDVEASGRKRTMHDIESEAIRRALAEVGGNRRLAAEQLGIGVRTLYEKLKRYGIE